MKFINKILIKLHIKKPPEDCNGEEKDNIKLPPPVAERLRNENLNLDDLIFSFK